jgi:hypothetical protein
VENTNTNIKKEMRRRPSSFVYSYLHFGCIHGLKPSNDDVLENDQKEIPNSSNEDFAPSAGAADLVDAVQEEKEKRSRASYYTGCTAHITITVPFNNKTKEYDGFSLFEFSGIHNHPVGKEVYDSYPRQRQIPDDPVLKALAQYDVNSRTIKQVIREEFNRPVLLKDIYNFKYRSKKEKDPGDQSVESKVEDLLGNLPQGSKSFVLFDDNLEIKSVCFQTTKMAELYAAYPESIIVDTTYLVCSQRYGLLTLMITDASGHGRPVLFALISSETKEILNEVIGNFFISNNCISKTKSIIMDKDFVEIDVFKKYFPSAVIKICQFHSIKYLSKEICNEAHGISLNNRKQLKAVFPLLCRAASEKEYNEAYELLKKYSSESFMKYFDENWNECKEMWVHFLCSYLSLGNTTTNRLESFHDKLKQFADRNTPIYKLITILLSIITCVEQETQYKLSSNLLKRTRKAQMGMEDFIAVYTPFACDLVEQQLKLSKLQYRRDGDFVKNVESGKNHQCNGKECDCIFFKSLQLPCRHLLFLRREAGIDLVGEISERWSIQYALQAENSVLSAPSSVHTQVQIKSPDLLEKILNSREKFKILQPIYADISTILCQTGTKDFNEKRTQLLELVNSWKRENSSISENSTKNSSSSSSEEKKTESERENSSSSSSEEKKTESEKGELQNGAQAATEKCESKNGEQAKISFAKLHFQESTKQIGRPKETEKQLRIKKNAMIQQVKNGSNLVCISKLNEAVRERDRNSDLQLLTRDFPVEVSSSFSVLRGGKHIADDFVPNLAKNDLLLMEANSLTKSGQKRKRAYEKFFKVSCNGASFVFSEKTIQQLFFLQSMKLFSEEIRQLDEWICNAAFEKPSSSFFKHSKVEVEAFAKTFLENFCITKRLVFFQHKKKEYFTFAHLKELFEERWVSDNLINFFLRELSAPEILCMDTFFLNMLTQEQSTKELKVDERRLQRQAVALRKKNFNGRYILFPACLTNTHWIIYVCDMESRIMYVYDSLRYSYKEGSGHVFLEDELFPFTIRQIIAKVYGNADEFLFRPITSPEQHDGGSCAVYVLTFAEMFACSGALEQEEIWGHENIPYLRMNMLYRISNGTEEFVEDKER